VISRQWCNIGHDTSCEIAEISIGSLDIHLEYSYKRRGGSIRDVEEDHFGIRPFPRSQRLSQAEMDASELGSVGFRLIIRRDAAEPLTE